MLTDLASREMSDQGAESWVDVWATVEKNRKQRDSRLSEIAATRSLITRYGEHLIITRGPFSSDAARSKKRRYAVMAIEFTGLLRFCPEYKGC